MRTNIAYIPTLLLLLGMLFPLPALAQQDEDPVQDAMYVYRNDGKFHGFFNAEVVRVEFSKIDTLGREHLDYVVQEIETLDSLYRIPISAIDSVSFYTPRTEYAEGVKATTSSSLWDYVVASDTLTSITLSAATPAELVPAVGDKLCTTKSRKLLPGGFYGTVRKVTATPEGTRLECENEGLQVYLKRHIFKGGLQVNEDEQSLARRRKLALRRAPDSPSIVRETLDTIKFEKKLEGEFELNDNFKISGEMSANIALVPTIYASVFGAIGMSDGMNLDCSLYVNAKTIADFVMKAKLEWSNDIPASKFYIWITDTPFFIELQPGIHFGMSGELEVDHHEEVSISAMASAVINESLFTDRVMTNSKAELLDRKSETKAIGTFTGNLGPYYAVNLIIGTEEVGVLGLRVEAGAKMSVSAEMDFNNPEAVDEISTTVYDRLKGNGSMKIGPYGQVGYNWAFFEKLKGENNIWEYEPGWEFNGGLVPKFNNVDVYTYTPESKQITVSANVDGNVVIFLGAPVGFALFDDKGKEIARKFDTRNYFDPRLWNYYELMFDGVEYNKWYTVHPVCKLMGNELIASPGKKFFAGERDLIVEPSDSLKFHYTGGTQFISVKNTFSDETGVSHEYVKDDWMTYQEVPGGYNITVKPNETTHRREVTLSFTATNPESMFDWRQRNVVIHQDIDPAFLGLLMQSCNITADTDEERSDLWIWTPCDREIDESGRWDLWGFVPLIGKDDIEDAFNRNPVITPNADGTFTLNGNGLTINGKFSPVAEGERYRLGQGTFRLTTDMQHHRKSKEDVEEMLHNGPNLGETKDFVEFINPALDEHYKRTVEGTVYVSWDEYKQQYEFNFIGRGTMTYDAECYYELRGLNHNYSENGENVFYTRHPNATLGETKNVSINCNTTIDCTVMYELNE